MLAIITAYLLWLHTHSVESKPGNNDFLLLPLALRAKNDATLVALGAPRPAYSYQLMLRIYIFIYVCIDV